MTDTVNSRNYQNNRPQLQSVIPVPNSHRLINSQIKKTISRTQKTPLLIKLEKS